MYFQYQNIHVGFEIGSGADPKLSEKADSDPRHGESIYPECQCCGTGTGTVGTVTF
jgi:hypothetical protein